MHTPRRKYQITLHSLSEIQLHENNLSKIGMKCISHSAKLNSLSLNFHQLGDIQQLLLKVITQEKHQCFLPQIILKISCLLLLQIDFLNLNAT